MQKHIKKIVLVSFLVIGISVWAGYQFQVREVFAGASHNTSGWAWSSNVGWISFNCTDTGTCGTADYGVHVNPTTGELSGFAWSSNIGWISFNRANTGTPPAAPYNGSESFIACFDRSGVTTELCNAANDNKVYGWARALSHGSGWDGWIKLRDASWTPGVSWNSAGNEFAGFAWGSDVVGWVSFNAKDCDSDGNGLTDTGANLNCPVGLSISNYKVTSSLAPQVNQPPVAAISCAPSC